MRVAPGREIDINGRRYLAGDELPPMSSELVAQLSDRGDIELPTFTEFAEHDQPRGRRR